MDPSNLSRETCSGTFTRGLETTGAGKCMDVREDERDAPLFASLVDKGATEIEGGSMPDCFTENHPFSAGPCPRIELMSS